MFSLRTIVCFATLFLKNAFYRGTEPSATVFLHVTPGNHAEIVKKVLTRYGVFGIINLILCKIIQFLLWKLLKISATKTRGYYYDTE